MFSIHGTSSTLYVSILEMLQICSLYFVMNKVLVSITYLHFSPLCFNLHIWSPSTTILHTNLQYENCQPRFRRISFSKSPKLSPNGFLQNCRTISPKRRRIIAKNRRKSFRQNRRTRFLQIAEQVFSKASNVFPPTLQCISPHVLSKNAKHFTPNLQVVSPISEQRMFCSVLLGDNPVSDLSLHVP